MRYDVIIPAAGKGERLHLGYNKVFYKINGKTLIEKTISPFIQDEDCIRIILVVAEVDLERMQECIQNKKVAFVLGDKTREESVNNGLKSVKEEYVLVHDGDRCEIKAKLIESIKNELRKANAVIPVISIKEALNNYGRTINDKQVQTPQGFKSSLLKECFLKTKCLEDYKDEASIVEKYYGVKEINGDIKNIKITDEKDLKLIGG